MERSAGTERWGNIADAPRGAEGIENLRYGYMRARTRAIAVSAGGALVIAPLTGIAAVALATPSEEAPVTPDAAVVAELQARTAATTARTAKAPPELDQH